MAPTFTVRKSADRGHANLGWLDTHHTFSFGDYEDQNFDGFGTLRVLNEDILQPGKGFGTHRHREYEILSYVVYGQLEHKDSAGHRQIIERGDVQFTTAGSGISHSEYNPSTTDPVHFLQIWNLPSNTRLRPGYTTAHFPDSCKRNQFVTLVAPAKKRDAVRPPHSDATKPIAIHSEFWMSATLLEAGKEVFYRTPLVGDPAKVSAHPRRVYIHIVQNNPDAKISVTSQNPQGATAELLHGDGMFVKGFSAQVDELILKSEGVGVTEIVVMDLAQ
ncbi:hypothetical protein HDU93_006278 [Gonapodya sp. JEL0774]|nr:hypothetical protein HDU93_006278 [Gonapodya sp. JEL0774]